MHWLYIREPFSAWSHLLVVFAAIPATLFLLRLCRGDRFKQAGMLVYGCSLIFLYASSGLYHAVRPEYEATAVVFDHIAIYLLIAGTVTPIALIGLRGRSRVSLLVTLWLMAAAGIVLRLFFEPPLAVRTTLYLVMGWVGCLMYFELAQRLSHRKVRPVWVGGLFYSAGAAINLIGFPPGFAGGLLTAHDVFHLFVIAGTVSHYAFMVGVLAPYPRTKRSAAGEVPVKVPSLAYVRGRARGSVRTASDPAV